MPKIVFPKKMFKMVILGAPGSGKGTISNRIVRDFGLKHISTGDVLRAHVTNKSFIGIEADRYIKNGQLVPDNVMVKLISDELSRMGTTPWLLDGFPRTLNQANVLASETELDLVLSLSVPSNVIIDRIRDRWVHLPSGRIYNIIFNPPREEGKDDITGEPLIQRPDDAPEAVAHRLEVYDINTKPLKEFYEKLNLLKEFHGTETNEIYPRVQEYMKSVLPVEGKSK